MNLGLAYRLLIFYLLHYSPPDKNKMASRFVPVRDEQIFVLNEAVVSPNTKKATKDCLTVCRGIL
jgi:hypothetical protein